MNATIVRERSVLVVEDSPETRTQITDLLEREGYSVEYASCGETALTLLREHDPDLV